MRNSKIGGRCYDYSNQAATPNHVTMVPNHIIEANKLLLIEIALKKFKETQVFLISTQD